MTDPSTNNPATSVSTPNLSPKTLPVGNPANTSNHPVAVYVPADVAKHNTSADLWLIIDKAVYNVTDFQAEHPGGARILSKVAGKDASKEFHKYHRDSIIQRYQERLQVGVLTIPAKKKGFLSRLLGFKHI